MAKKVNKSKPQTININPNQPPPPKPKRQIGQYDKIFQENLAKLLPLLIKEVLKMDIVYREQLPTRVQHTEERDPDMPIEQYVVYIGNEKPKNITGYFKTTKMTHEYTVIDFSDIPYKVFLESNIPEVIVFSILGNLTGSTPKNVAIEAVQRINALESGELKKKKYFKQLRIVANIRNLAPLIDKVMENITQYFVPERDPWFNKGFQQGEEKKEVALKREFTALSLISPDHSVEKIARLLEVSVEYVEGIKNEVAQIRVLLETNTIAQTARLLGVPFDYVRKIKKELGFQA